MEFDVPDVQAVAGIVRAVAEAEIMPRFRALGAGDISEKRPGEVVTTADIEAEKALAEALRHLAPAAAVVGEEGIEEDPAAMNALAGPGPVWVLDPVDGTQNFADGVECFVVIVAYCLAGETVAGWIHDPVREEIIWAVKGQGAWHNDRRLHSRRVGERRLRVAEPVPVGAMNGSLGHRFRRRIQASAKQGSGKLNRLGCVGREYMDLALGRLHFARYGGRLKPWDHAAGVLIHAEAGGAHALMVDGAETTGPYTPGPGIQRGTLIMAPDEGSSRALHAALAVT